MVVFYIYMVKLSKKTVELLKDDIISILYERSLVPMSAYEICVELRRNNEFTKKLLLELEEDGLVREVGKNSDGRVYLRNKKWMIPAKVLKAFEKG